MQDTLEHTAVTFEEISSFSPIYGTWTSPTGEKIVSSIYNGGGGARDYRGVKMLFGVAEENIWVKHHRTEVLIAKTGEKFAVLWDGGQFGKIVSQTMSMGYYTIARAPEGTDLLPMLNALAALKRKKSLYTRVTMPTWRDYYSDELWEVLNNDSYKWEELTRVTPEAGVLYVSDGENTFVFYHMPGSTEKFWLRSRSRGYVPTYSEWVTMQKIIVMSYDQRTGISVATIKQWGMDAIYKQTLEYLKPVSEEDAKTLNDILTRMGDKSWLNG
jgi:hypothetical protein